MELVSRCVECGLAEPESLASLGGSAPGVVDGILSPDIYLGPKAKPMKRNYGVTAYAISPSKYVNEAVNNCEKWIQENMPDHKYSSRVSNPFPTDYDPDLDTTNELDEDQAT